MAIALVQQQTDSIPSGTSLQVTLPGTITTGNLLILTLTGNNQHAVSVSGGRVTTWVKAKESAKTNYIADVWYGLVTSTGSPLAITITYGSSTSAGANLSEWSGLLTSGALDASTRTNVGTSNTPTPGSMTAASPGPVVYISTMARAAATAVSSGPTDSFTALTVAAGGGVVPNVSCYRIDTGTPAAANPAWTLAASIAWEDTMVAFRAAAPAIVAAAGSFSRLMLFNLPGRMLLAAGPSSSGGSGFDNGMTYHDTPIPTGAGWTDGSDARAAIQALIDGAPDGLSTTVHRRFLFPAGNTWVIGRALNFDGLNHVTFEGLGTETANAHTGGAVIHTNGDPTTHKSGCFATNFASTSAIRAQDIRWHCMTLEGNSTNFSTSSAGDGGEFQAGIECWGVDDIEVSHVIFDKNKGDAINLSDGSFGLFSSAHPSTNIWIHHSTLKRNGRQLIAVIHGTDIQIEDNLFEDACYSYIDIEPDVAYERNGNILIQRNTFGGKWNWDTTFNAGGIFHTRPTGADPTFNYDGFLRILNNTWSGINNKDTTFAWFWDVFGPILKAGELTINGNNRTVGAHAGPAVKIDSWSAGATITNNTNFITGGSWFTATNCGAITNSGNT